MRTCLTFVSVAAAMLCPLSTHAGDECPRVRNGFCCDNLTIPLPCTECGPSGCVRCCPQWQNAQTVGVVVCCFPTGWDDDSITMAVKFLGCQYKEPVCLGCSGGCDYPGAIMFANCYNASNPVGVYDCP